MNTLQNYRTLILNTLGVIPLIVAAGCSNTPGPDSVIESPQQMESSAESSLGIDLLPSGTEGGNEPNEASGQIADDTFGIAITEDEVTDAADDLTLTESTSTLGEYTDSMAEKTNDGTDRASITAAITPPSQRVFHFNFDKAGLSEQDKALISEHAQFLLENPNKKIIINGHADGQGNPDYNKFLSRKRARYVADLLTSQGIPSERIEIFSWGDTTPAGEINNWKQNRRVELNYSEDYYVSK